MIVLYIILGNSCKCICECIILYTMATTPIFVRVAVFLDFRNNNRILEELQLNRCHSIYCGKT